MFFVLVINLIRSPDGFLPQFGAVNGNVGTKTLKVLKILKMDLRQHYLVTYQLLSSKPLLNLPSPPTKNDL